MQFGARPNAAGDSRGHPDTVDHLRQCHIDAGTGDGDTVTNSLSSVTDAYGYESRGEANFNQSTANSSRRRRADRNCRAGVFAGNRHSYIS